MLDRPEKQYHEREYALTEKDAELIKGIIAAALNTRDNNIPHTESECRFAPITKEEFMEIIISHRKFNTLMDDSKKTVAKFFLVLALVFITGVFTDGLWSKLATKIKNVVSP